MGKTKVRTLYEIAQRPFQVTVHQFALALTTYAEARGWIVQEITIPFLFESHRKTLLFIKPTVLFVALVRGYRLELSKKEREWLQTNPHVVLWTVFGAANIQKWLDLDRESSNGEEEDRSAGARPAGQEDDAPAVETPQHHSAHRSGMGNGGIPLPQA